MRIALARKYGVSGSWLFMKRGVFMLLIRHTKMSEDRIPFQT